MRGAVSGRLQVRATRRRFPAISQPRRARCLIPDDRERSLMMRKSSPEIVTFPKAEKEAVRIAAYVGDRETEQQLHELFGRWGYETTYIQKGRIPDARRDYANRNMPPVLIVDISYAALPLSELKTLADICPPEVNVVALGTRDTVGLYRDLMEIGVTDYLVKPVPADLLFRAIARASGQ